jgi:dynein heavy chain, axonemal
VQVEDRALDGVYVDDLFIDGARWNSTPGCIADAMPGVMYSTLPVIHFKPVKESVIPSAQYSCPLYKTSMRAGILSTTGQSTNFVLHVGLPMAEGTREDYWILQGVALLCMLDD